MKKDSISLKRKEEICAALKQMMKRKSIQKITIQELADECGISRYTFYYHFTDIYDCLSWMLVEELRNHLQQTVTNPTLENAFAPFIQSIRENKSSYKHLKNSPRPVLLHDFFHQEIKSVVQLFLSEIMKSNQYQATESYLSFLTEYFTSAMEGMLISCIQMDSDCSDELLMEYLHTVLDGKFESTIKYAEQKGFCTKMENKPQNQSGDCPDAWNYLL